MFARDRDMLCLPLKIKNFTLALSDQTLDLHLYAPQASPALTCTCGFKNHCAKDMIHGSSKPE